jgi:hypothetical protein
MAAAQLRQKISSHCSQCKSASRSSHCPQDRTGLGSLNETELLGEGVRPLTGNIGPAGVEAPLPGRLWVRLFGAMNAGKTWIRGWCDPEISGCDSKRGESVMRTGADAELPSRGSILGCWCPTKTVTGLASCVVLLPGLCGAACRAVCDAASTGKPKRKFSRYSAASSSTEVTDWQSLHCTTGESCGFVCTRRERECAAHKRQRWCPHSSSNDASSIEAAHCAHLAMCAGESGQARSVASMPALLSAILGPHMQSFEHTPWC